MGEMADFALDNAMDDLEHYEKFKDSSPSEQYEEGLVDEYGNPIGDPNL